MKMKCFTYFIEYIVQQLLPPIGIQSTLGKDRAVVVAQLAEWSLPNLEVRGSKPVVVLKRRK